MPLLIGVPGVVVGARWYLRRAGAGYLRENASYSRMNASLTETVEGARTVEALGLAGARIARIDDDIAESYAAERYTLMLRTRFFPSVEVTSYLLPSVATLLLGGWLYGRGEVSLGEVTAATLYVQMLIDPVDRLVAILDELQVGAASLSRLLGVGEVPDDRVTTDRTPQGDALVARDVRFSYVEGRDVLHGVDLTLAVGERLAMVGPSGAGKSTLGRLLAGIHPPRTGTVEVGGVGLTELPLAQLRGRVALVTQEHHVFVGTVRENLALAVDRGPSTGDGAGPGGDAGDDADAQLFAALEAVDADLGCGAPPGSRHRGRLGRPRPRAGPGPAAGAGAAGARRPAHVGARRGDLADRPSSRAPPGALARRGARGTHRRGHRSPAVLRPRRRPGRGGRGRRRQRAGLARRARRPGRLLRAAVGVLAGLSSGLRAVGRAAGR